MTAVGVVLAAGAGTRFGSPKAEVRVDGERLLDRAIGVLRAGGCAEVVAVVRAGVEVAGATAVVNPDPDRGMSSSLWLGLDAAAEASAGVAVILLVDLPGVPSDAVMGVLGAHDAGAMVAVATYAGTRGHPVAFDRACWAEVAAAARGDNGARAYLAAHPDQVIEVACVGESLDVDTPADLEAWAARKPPPR
ncbi:MAG: nucleotidyltransferase family protein [Jatrophihabitans sp.]